MANAIDKAIRAQGGAVVTPFQVKAMILAARRAYMQQAAIGLVDEGEDFDAWRKAALHDIVESSAPDSFRAVTQRDYAAVLGYFLELAGERPAPRPRPCELRKSDELARALWSLNEQERNSAGTFGGPGGMRKYTDSLFWKIHKTDRFTATPRQIWAVIFTIRSRAGKIAARHASKPLKNAPRSASSGDRPLVAPGMLQAFSRVFPRLSGDSPKKEG